MRPLPIPTCRRIRRKSRLPIRYSSTADAGDLRLRTGSPCIDAGTTVPYLTADIDGTARPQGSALTSVRTKQPRRPPVFLGEYNVGLLSADRAFIDQSSPGAAPVSKPRPQPLCCIRGVSAMAAAPVRRQAVAHVYQLRRL